MPGGGLRAEFYGAARRKIATVIAPVSPNFEVELRKKIRFVKKEYDILVIGEVCRSPGEF